MIYKPNWFLKNISSRHIIYVHARPNEAFRSCSNFKDEKFFFFIYTNFSFYYTFNVLLRNFRL